MTELTTREHQLFDWVKQQFSPEINTNLKIKLISGDASFRRYYRVESHLNGQSEYFIAVDAPPETENNPLFIELANILTHQGVNVPKVIAAELTQGFMLQTDQGDIHLANVIKHSNYHECYTALWPLLFKINTLNKDSLTCIDSYNAKFVEFELSIFDDWFIAQYLEYQLSASEQALLSAAKTYLVEQFLAQPQVAVHRDFHCRNIMLQNADIKQPVVIDFQGMLIGPVCYDLVSLLKDCYLVWPKAEVNYLSDSFRAEFYPQYSSAQWQTWFDLTGLQRHIKCLGIFARLAMRDNKPAYLEYLPDVMDYVQNAAADYPELAKFSDWLKETIVPKFKHKYNKQDCSA